MKLMSLSWFRSLPKEVLLVFSFLLCGLAWIMVDSRAFGGTTAANVVDAWVYTGYILSMPYHLRNFPGAYYGTRLTYLAPGYILQLIFGPELGGFLLRFMFYMLLILFAYLFYRSRRSIPAAAILAGCFLSSRFLVSYFIDDYISGAGLSTIMMSLFFMERSITTKSTHWWLLTGVAMALMLHTNLFLSVFIPCFGVYWLFQDDLRYKFLYKRLFLLLLGIVSVTICFGFINWLWGGQFLFFMPNIDITKWVLLEKNPWNPEGWAWVEKAPWLALPLLGLLCSFWQFTLACIRREWKTVRSAFAAANIIVCIIFVVFQMMGKPILAVVYYAVYLVPFGLISIVDCVIGDETLQLPQLKTLTALPLTFGVLTWWIFFVFLTYSIGFWLLRGSSQQLAYLIQMLMPVIALSLSLTFLSKWLSGYLRLMGLALVLSVLQMWFFVHSSCIYPSSEVLVAYPALTTLNRQDCPVQRGLFQEVVELHKLTYRLSDGEKPAFWFDGNANPELNTLFNGVSGTFLWGSTIVAIDYPHLSVGPLGAPRMDFWSQNGILVVMFPAEQSLEEGIATLRQNGIDPEVVYQENRELDGIQYTFAVLRRKTSVFENTLEQSAILDWNAQRLRGKESANYYDLFQGYRPALMFNNQAWSKGKAN